MPDLERIQQLTPGTLSQQWYEDGAAVDPGTVTIGITRADGTVLVAAGAATTGTGTAARTYNLTTTHTALLDALTVTWTSTLKGTLISYVEIVGGFLFTISQARGLPPLNNTTTYPTATLLEMRTTVEQAIEDEYGTALVPRYRLETFSGDGTRTLRLRDPVRTIRSATVGDTALTAGNIADLTTNYGFVVGYTWTAGIGNIVVGYEYGLDSPPPRIAMDAIRLARQWLVGGPVDDRASTFSSTEGGTYGLLVPGRGGSIFGLPDLDSAIQSSPYRLGVA
jgi:hypothetical protein